MAEGGKKPGRPRLSGPDGPLGPRKNSDPRTKIRGRKPAGAKRRYSPKNKGLPIWWDAFFAHFAESGIKYEACHAAGISYSTPSKWVEDHPGPLAEQFYQAHSAATEIFRDRLRREAVVRGIEGWEEQVISFYKGEVIFITEEVVVKDELGNETKTTTKRLPTVRKKSDLIFLAMCNANLPEFGRQRHEILHLGEADLENLTDEELFAIRSGEDPSRFKRARLIGSGTGPEPPAEARDVEPE